MILTLNESKNIVTVPAVTEQTVAISEIDIISITDNLVNELKALVDVNGTHREIILYRGSDYTALIQSGNWTRQQVFNKIIELI